MVNAAQARCLPAPVSGQTRLPVFNLQRSAALKLRLLWADKLFAMTGDWLFE